MNQMNLPSKFNTLPIRLTKKQRKDPCRIINNFFDDLDLDDVRFYVSEWLECALTSDNTQFSEAGQRANIICFAEKLEGLIEAAYILGVKRKR